MVSPTLEPTEAFRPPTPANQSSRISGVIRLIVWIGCLAPACLAAAATTQPAYYVHRAIEDRDGVIAPWYKGLNGQCDWRVRISAETLKRYPWADSNKALAAAPEYIYNGQWRITTDGAISVPEQKDWDNGDLGQRAAFAIVGWLNYYRYSSDPAALAHVSMIADVLA